jgi:hypothetical protein
VNELPPENRETSETPFQVPVEAVPPHEAMQYPMIRRMGAPAVREATTQVEHIESQTPEVQKTSELVLVPSEMSTFLIEQSVHLFQDHTDSTERTTDTSGVVHERLVLQPDNASDLSYVVVTDRDVLRADPTDETVDPYHGPSFAFYQQLPGDKPSEIRVHQQIVEDYPADYKENYLPGVPRTTLDHETEHRIQELTYTAEPLRVYADEVINPRHDHPLDMPPPADEADRARQAKAAADTLRSATSGYLTNTEGEQAAVTFNVQDITRTAPEGFEPSATVTIERDDTPPADVTVSLATKTQEADGSTTVVINSTKTFTAFPDEVIQETQTQRISADGTVLSTEHSQGDASLGDVLRLRNLLNQQRRLQ